jgi:hypothetical protein
MPQPTVVVLLVALLLLVLVSPPPETIPLMAMPPVVVGVTFKGKLTLPLAGILGELLVHTIVVECCYWACRGTSPTTTTTAVEG